MVLYIHALVDLIFQELVLRFLQRAANNLQQPFKVTVPSSKLSINDRRSLLAKQLHEFLRIYDKVTIL